MDARLIRFFRVWFSAPDSEIHPTEYLGTRSRGAKKGQDKGHKGDTKSTKMNWRAYARRNFLRVLCVSSCSLCFPFFFSRFPRLRVNLPVATQQRAVVRHGGISGTLHTLHEWHRFCYHSLSNVFLRSTARRVARG
jgi:hypothetical protein